MLFFKSINDIPEDVYLENILNEITNDEDDLEEFVDVDSDDDE